MGFVPLEEVKVLDFSRVLAGPYCTMMLADLGADVVKVERPGMGDDSRFFPPFVDDHSAYFINVNRGKRSVAIDLSNPKGRELVLELAGKADVLVENFRPGVMDRLGLGYDHVKRMNSRIIYASISLAGQSGPYRDLGGYDLIGQAMGGIMSITGWPNTPPTRVGTAVADILAGLNCAVAVLAALRARDSTGEGQRVDISLVDSVFSADEAYNMMYLAKGRVPKRTGNRYEFVYPYDTFRTEDGWIAIGAGNDKLWGRLCGAMRMPDLIDDPRFRTNEDRLERHGELKGIIEGWTRSKSTREALEALRTAGVPAGPVYDIDEACKDPHIARRMLAEIEQPGIGKMTIVENPIKISPANAGVRGPAPLLGQHNREVLREWLGLRDGKMEELEASGVLGRSFDQKES